jgi:hypothetical protein
MLRLVLVLLCVTLTLAVLLQQRTRHAALRSQNLRLAGEVERARQTLWQRQVMVAANVAPGSIEQHVASTPANVVPTRPEVRQQAQLDGWEQLLQ